MKQRQAHPLSIVESFFTEPGSRNFWNFWP